MDRLCALKEKHPSVGDVRGVGLFCGVELVRDRKTKQPFDDYDAKVKGKPSVVAQTAGKAMAAGTYVVPMTNTLIIAPPLIITEAQIDEGVAALDRALSWADEQI